LKRLEKA